VGRIEVYKIDVLGCGMLQEGESEEQFGAANEVINFDQKKVY